MADAALDDTPEVIQQWVRQLLAPDLVDLIRSRTGQVEVRLFCNGSRVRKEPVILLNAGSQPIV